MKKSEKWKVLPLPYSVSWYASSNANLEQYSFWSVEFLLNSEQLMLKEDTFAGMSVSGKTQKNCWSGNANKPLRRQVAVHETLSPEPHLRYMFYFVETVFPQVFNNDYSLRQGSHQGGQLLWNFPWEARLQKNTA